MVGVRKSNVGDTAQTSREGLIGAPCSLEEGRLLDNWSVCRGRGFGGREEGAGFLVSDLMLASSLSGRERGLSVLYEAGCFFLA